MEPLERPDADTAQRVLMAWKALNNDKLHLPPHMAALAQEIKDAPLLANGLVDTTRLSSSALMLARSAGMALLHGKHEQAPAPLTIPSADLQETLFALFARLFGALTGRAVDLVLKEEEIRDLMVWRIKHDTQAFEVATNEATQALASFYDAHYLELFRRGQQLGGMRLLSGGQRVFQKSALTSLRLTALYADTQLIPDPIYPFLEGGLNLNAAHLQLAIALFHILSLRPLVDARFPVPPVFVFPSFERSLEGGDAHTKMGLEKLIVSVIGPHCKGTIESLDDLFAYTRRQDDAFAQELLNAKLFVPPNGTPGEMLSIAQAREAYLSGLAGIRSQDNLEELRQLPAPSLIVNGIMERLSPQYHLLENANEMNAQPLLSQVAHWHYFEMSATASAQELVRKNVLSEQSYQTLRAIQDDSIAWLADIPVDTLRDLIANNEHRWFREEMNRYTALLATESPIDSDAMVREVNHGLAAMVQKQHAVMNEIQNKYAPRKAAIIAAGIAGVATAGVVTLLPMLSPLLGSTLPAVAALGSAVGAVAGVGQAKVGALVEKRQARRSMIGVLAARKPA